MTRRNLPVCNRVLSHITTAIVLTVMLALGGIANQLFAQTQPTGPKIWLGERQLLPQQGAANTAGAARTAI